MFFDLEAGQVFPTCSQTSVSAFPVNQCVLNAKERPFRPYPLRPDTIQIGTGWAVDKFRRSRRNVGITVRSGVNKANPTPRRSRYYDDRVPSGQGNVSSGLFLPPSQDKIFRCRGTKKLCRVERSRLVAAGRQAPRGSSPPSFLSLPAVHDCVRIFRHLPSPAIFLPLSIVPTRRPFGDGRSGKAGQHRVSLKIVVSKDFVDEPCKLLIASFDPYQLAFLVHFTLSHVCFPKSSALGPLVSIGPHPRAITHRLSPIDCIVTHVPSISNNAYHF